MSDRSEDRDRGTHREPGSDRDPSNDRDATTEQRVRQASPGDPEAGFRAASTEPVEERREASSSGGDTPDEVREEDSRAATERIRRMQQEGKGMGGTSTQGRSDVVDEEALEEATRGED